MEEFDAKQYLTGFYSREYRGRSKSDSPEKSRIDLINDMLAAFKFARSSLVLNVGSGPQILEKQLMLGRRPEVVAMLKQFDFLTLDLSDITANKLLGKNLENVNHVRADAEHLPLPDSCVGMGVSNLAIDFAGRSALAELARVMIPGSPLLLNFHHPKMIPADLDTCDMHEEVRTYWQYLRNTRHLFESTEQIAEELSGYGFVVAEAGEVAVKEPSATQYWWKVRGYKA